MRLYLVLFFLSAGIFTVSGIAKVEVGAKVVEIGEKAPDVEFGKWFSGKPKPFKGHNTAIIFVENFASISGIADILSDINSNYSDKSLSVVVVLRKAGKKTDRAGGGLKGIDIASDSSGDAGALFMSADEEMPFALVIDKKGVLVWKGNPVFLAEVLKRIYDGKFDVRKAGRVYRLRKKLNCCLRANDIDSSIKTARELLGIEPADRMAVQIVLFDFQRRGDIKGALVFIDRIIKVNPDEEIYFRKLDILLKRGVEREIRKCAGNIMKTFKDKPLILDKLARTLLAKSSFGNVPLETAIESSLLSVKAAFADKSFDRKFLVLDTFARCYFSIGLIDKAIEIQTKCVREAGRFSSRVMNKEEKILNFYKKAAKLRDRFGKKPATE